MTYLFNDGFPFTRDQLSALNLSAQSLRAALREHRLRRVLHNVFVDSEVPDSRGLRCQALLLIAPPHGVLCGVSVLWLHGIDAYQPEDRFDLRPRFLVPHGTTRPQRAEVVSHEGYLKPHEITHVQGVPTTTIVHTMTDLLRQLRRPFALSAADAVVRAGLVSQDEIVDALAPLRGYPGIIQARSLSILVDPRAESPGESWQRLRMIDAGFPQPDLQHDVLDRHGQTIARLDHAYVEVRVGAEYDGAEYHTEVDRRHDEERRRLLTDVYGWRIVVARKADILGSDSAFETTVGGYLGMSALGRSW